MTKSQVQNLRLQLQKFLDSLNLGFQFTVGNAAYGENVVFKLTCNPLVNGVPLNPQAEDFKTYAHLFGLKPQQLGQVFTFRSNLYEIVGLKRSSPKYPVLAKCKKNGKIIKFMPSTIMKCS